MCSATHTDTQIMMSSSKQEKGRLFSSRILSRDRSSVANASFRVYYSLGAGTVPFVWETKPGTPKSNLVPASGAGAAYLDEAPAPPMISPPPSYQSRITKKCARRPSSSSSWPSRWGWMTRWPLHIGRWRPLSPSPSSRSPTTDVRDRWLGPDSHHGAVDRRRPRRRAILLCF